MNSAGKILKIILDYVHPRPMSLAGKCRLLFGLAILFVLILALFVPYFWMGKLTDKTLIDAGRAVVNTVYERHFNLGGASEKSPVMLDESGAVKQTQSSRVNWVRLNSPSQPNWKDQLDAKQSQRIEGLLKQQQRTDERTWVDDVNGNAETTYINIVRANKRCLSCHSAEGSAPTFALSEPVGAVMVQMPGREISRTVLMNRICIFAAGLLAIAGAIVAFYIIAQRIILSPIRQLRAMVNNVSQGNLDVRCGIKTKDEFERLGDALNAMLDGLAEGQKKLRTANKQLDEKLTELSERNIELFRANKIKGEFLANMSHEFRTPLNAILGFAEIMREKPAENTAKNKRYAENIINSGKSLLNMINDLLELAKAEAGKIELHIEKTSIPELCRGLVAFFSPLTEKQKLKVRLTVDEEIPLIKTDAGKVQQILYNLLSNAVKFTPEKGKIEIKAFMPDDQTVRVSVSDTGSGINHADKEKIFEKFRQADGSLTRTQPGTGLGLAISTELARLLSGKIDLESTAGQGATFWLDLPIVRADEA
ncbi:MAG: HAMP domain-containing histidine kinase [Planctomycetes bacterium]|nr:HAMP domain-containing histidine kinase [Planctomycetota bacterium]MBU1518910.1 HAMP domain-containing histidine kinase [Planctomycetota bacterium]